MSLLLAALQKHCYWASILAAIAIPLTSPGRRATSGPIASFGRGSRAELCNPLTLVVAQTGCRLGRDVRGFDDGVELLGVGALFARAVAGFLPAAERHVVVQTRGRQIHHHQAALRMPLEVTGIFQRRGHDAGR